MKMATTRGVFDVLKILTTPVPTKDASSAKGKPASHHLDDSLANALTALNQFLQSGAIETNFPSEVKSELTLLTSDPCPDARWQHVRCCLLLLRTLHSHLSEEMKTFKESQERKMEEESGIVKRAQPKESDAPPLPPDAISIGHQKVLATTLQFVVTMGICPYLSPGIGVPLELRSGFSRALSTGPAGVSEQEILQRLYEVVSTLLSCVSVPSLGGVILTKHLGDLMSSLLQILYEPRSIIEDTKREKQCEASTEPSALSVEDSQEYCQRQLSMLLERAYQPSIMRELLVLQGGPGRPKKVGKSPTSNPLPRAPRWLKRVCADLLMVRVMQKRGVQNLLRAVLDVSGGAVTAETNGPSNLDWQRCDAVARILTDCKSTSIKEETYFKAIYPQILELLDYDDQLILQQVLRVCCTTISEMMKRCPGLTQEQLITPLQAPLLSTLETATLPDVSEDQFVTIATEEALTRCLENLFKVYLEGSEPSSVVMTTIYPILHPLFMMYSTLKDSVWVLRPVVERLLLVSLQSCDHSTAIDLLAAMTGVKSHKKYPRMHQDVNFELGSSGGAAAVVHPPKSSDESFSESVFQGERTAACCTELLQAGKGKLDRLAADFFILVLKELTAVLDNPEDGSQTVNASPEGALLEVESRQLEGIARVQHALQVLAMVSSLCEGLGTTVLQSLDHMIAFAHATLERACKQLGAETEAPVGLEAETVMFAFGLLSAIISGSIEKKVTRDNRESLSSLLPLLEKISTEHLSETLRQMAGDLRIAIATHGAVQVGGMVRKVGKIREQDLGRGKQSGKKIEVLRSEDEVNGTTIGAKETTTVERKLESRSLIETPTDKLAGCSDGVSAADASVGNPHDDGGISPSSNMNVCKSGESERVDELSKECSIQTAVAPNRSGVKIVSKGCNPNDVGNSPASFGERGESPLTDATSRMCPEELDKWHESNNRGVYKDTHRASPGVKTPTSAVIGNIFNKDAEGNRKDASSEMAPSNVEDRPEDGAESEAFDRAFEELFDPLAPVRGHALIALSRLLQERDPKALSKQGTLLRLFLEHLSNEDSYVYLTAVGALVSLADRYPGEVISSLCAEYVLDCTGEAAGHGSKVNRNVETRLKVGEALVKATRVLGDLAPHYSRLLLNAFLSGVRDSDADVRASSLSNLGEVCQLLKFSLTGSINEIFHCLASVLQSDSEVSVRRACVLVITLLLRGLGADALQVLDGEIRDLYRLLKLLHARESDDVMLLHVQLALEELDILMRKFLFPKQTLSKKITVLP